MDPGVRIFRTGLFRSPRFRKGLSFHFGFQAHYVSSFWAFNDMWFYNPKLFNQLMESIPVVTSPLAT